MFIEMSHSTGSAAILSAISIDYFAHDACYPNIAELSMFLLLLPLVFMLIYIDPVIFELSLPNPVPLSIVVAFHWFCRLLRIDDPHSFFYYLFLFPSASTVSESFLLRMTLIDFVLPTATDIVLNHATLTITITPLCADDSYFCYLSLMMLLL